jgi:hypothetical protein
MIDHRSLQPFWVNMALTEKIDVLQNEHQIMNISLDWLSVKVKSYLICEGYMPVSLHPDNSFSRAC